MDRDIKTKMLLAFSTPFSGEMQVLQGIGRGIMIIEINNLI